MDKKYKVYKYTSPSGKVYIGQTCRSLKDRAYEGKGYIHSTFFYSAIKKYGFENFSCEILKDNLTLEEANYWETYYIAFYKTTDRQYGYNISPGGDNHIMSEEGKKRLSDRMKKNNPMKNSEVSNRVREKNIGRKHSQQTREKMSESRKKKIQCVETGEIFESRQAAAEYYNVSPSGIGRAATGEQLTSAGFHWRYI